MCDLASPAKRSYVTFQCGDNTDQESLTKLDDGTADEFSESGNCATIGTYANLNSVTTADYHKLSRESLFNSSAPSFTVARSLTDEDENTEGRHFNAQQRPLPNISSSPNSLLHLTHNVTSSPNLQLAEEKKKTRPLRRLSETIRISAIPENLSIKPERSTTSSHDSTVSVTSSSRRSATKRFSLIYYSLAPSYKGKLDQFRRIFLGTPVDTDRLLVDYSCALSKNNHGLLLQGRMYVTENWVCFYSKILQEKKIYLSVKEIIAITKEKTARVIPNAIQLLYSRNHQRFFFTSFASRERTYAILRKVWENCRNHQTMSIDEIVEQVREIYGDDSLATLEDEDSEGGTKSSPEIGQSQSTSATDDDNLSSTQLSNNLAADNPWAASRPLPPGPILKTSTTGSDDEAEDDHEFTISTPKHVQTIPDVVQHPPPQRPRPQLLSLTSELLVTSETDGIMDGLQSVSPNLSAAEERKRRSKKRHKRGRDSTTNKTQINPVCPSALVSFPFDPSDTCASCFPGHDHPGQMYVNTLIPLSVDALFACIFTDSEFFDRLSTSRCTFNMVQASWPPIPWSSGEYKTADPAVTVERVIGYTLTLKQKFGPRTCAAVERQTLIVSESRPRQCYVVDAKVTNQAVPLCNCFCVVSRYCLLRAGPLSSRLSVYSRVVYEKPVFLGGKTIIESTCRTGLTDFFTALTAQLTELSSCLNDEDRLTGGYLSAPSVNTEVTRADMSNAKRNDKTVRGKLDVGRSSETGKNATRSRPQANVSNRHSSSSPYHRKSSNRDASGVSATFTEFVLSGQLFHFKELAYFFLRPDRAWLLLCLISLLLCLCLSLVYTRLVALEQLAAQMAQTGQRSMDPSPFKFLYNEAPQTRLRMMKELTVTMSHTLSQMQQVLSKIQSSLELLDRSYTLPGGPSTMDTVPDASSFNSHQTPVTS